MEHIIGLSGLRPEHCCGWTRRNLAMLRCQAKALLILLLYIFLLFHMESTCNYLPKTLYRHVAWFFQTIFFFKNYRCGKFGKLFGSEPKQLYYKYKF